MPKRKGGQLYREIFKEGPRTMEGESYTQAFIVTSADCDIRRRMMPSALLRFCQTLSTDHCTALGLTTSYLAGHHLAFLLAKLACRW